MFILILFGISTPYKASELRVVVGVHNRSKSEDSKMVFEVEHTFTHPLYESANGHNNDIALVRLKGSIEYCREVAPVCLPDEEVPPGKICMTTGWGDAKGGHHIMTTTTESLLICSLCSM